MHRLAVILPTVIALIVAALFYPLFLEAESHIRSELRAAIAQEIAGLEEHFHERGLAGLRDTLQRRIDASADRDAIYLLTDRNGRVIVGNLADWPAGVKISDESWFHVRAADGSMLEGEVFVLFGGDRLLVGRQSPLESFQRRMSLRLWGSAGLIVLVAAAVGGYFSTQLQRRLARLTREAARIQEGHLSQRLSLSPRGDEFDALAERFNRAFDEIERLVDASRHVSSAIAHDMRRPLIALRQALDEAGASAPRSPLEDRRFESLRRQTDDLLHTFAALLSLARVEAGASGARREAVRLDRIAADAIDLHEPLAGEQGRALVGRLEEITVQGDRDLLFQALHNLIDNALKHGGGDIDVTVARDGPDHAKVCVRDHGRGVPDTALPRLFERFFRADASRSAPQGAGVGLALVKGLVEAHGGSVGARNAAPGLLVEIRLPSN